MKEKKKRIAITDISETIKIYGKDWSNIEIVFSKFEYAHIDKHKDIDLRNIILPKEKEFFKYSFVGLYKNKVYLPEGDYSNYNFNNVSISNMVFTKNSVLPKHKELFTKLRSKRLDKCVLPKADYTIYSFEGVEFSEVVFLDGSELPLDFFQQLKNKTIENFIMPKVDICSFNLNQINLYNVDFRKVNSIYDKDFFKKCDFKLETLYYFNDLDINYYNFESVC